MQVANFKGHFSVTTIGELPSAKSFAAKMEKLNNAAIKEEEAELEEEYHILEIAHKIRAYADRTHFN